MNLPPIKFELRGTKRNKQILVLFLQVLKISIINLLNEMQPLVFEKRRFVFFQENLASSNFWLSRSIEFAVPGDFRGIISLSYNKVLQEED